MNYINTAKIPDNSNAYTVRITPKGWRYLSELNDNHTSDTCFVAMSFHQEYQYIYDDIIEKAIVNAGWKPLCLLRDNHHNDYITNQIIAGIKRSKFIIAEFTGNSHGVYYEAGLARGLNMQVIHMVRNDFTESNEPDQKLHFDTVQINHLVWNDSEVRADVAKRLTDWIATVGFGPHFNML